MYRKIRVKSQIVPYFNDELHKFLDEILDVLFSTPFVSSRGTEIHLHSELISRFLDLGGDNIKKGLLLFIISRELFFYLHGMFRKMAFLHQRSLVGHLCIQSTINGLHWEISLCFIRPNTCLYILRYNAILQCIHLYQCRHRRRSYGRVHKYQPPM